MQRLPPVEGTEPLQLAGKGLPHRGLEGKGPLQQLEGRVRQAAVVGMILLGTLVVGRVLQHPAEGTAEAGREAHWNRPRRRERREAVRHNQVLPRQQAAREPEEELHSPAAAAAHLS